MAIGPHTDLRREAERIASAWRATRGEKPKDARPFSQEEIDLIDAMRVGPDGRQNSFADKLHSEMVMHNVRLGAAPTATETFASQVATPTGNTSQATESGQVPAIQANKIEQ